MSHGTKPALRVLSWGLGQDSTTIALLAEHGEIAAFDAIIWADTHHEPQEVYDTLAWVEPLLTPPVYRVTAGDLGADILRRAHAFRTDPAPATTHNPHAPFWIAMPGGKGGQLKRNCTQDYKVRPIRQKIRQLLGLSSTAHIPKGLWVEQAIGFPLDELGRTFCSDVQWIVNVFPLIDQRMRKHDCARWLTEHGYPIPPKSSCRWCPYHSNAYWRHLRNNCPEDWHKAVAFEAALHQGQFPHVRGTPYLHKSLVPLPLAVIDEPVNDQQELFCFACNT